MTKTIMDKMPTTPDLNRERLEQLKPGVARQAFLCGPPPMIEAVTEVLTGKGVPPGSIFHDAF